MPDSQGTSIYKPVVEHGNGLLALQLGFHLYKAEATDLPVMQVRDDFGKNYTAGLGKKSLQLFFSHLAGQIAYG
jgi:hypothetical protein